jgi:hypothetical protein
LKVPPYEQFSGMLQAAGLLIAGMIMGSALFLSIYHHHLNSTLIHNRELQDINEQLLQDNNAYRSNKNVQSRINRLDVVINSGEVAPLDKAVEQELERRIRNDLNVIKGQRISSFAESPHLYQSLIAQKTYHNVMDKDYTVYVTTMVLVQTELKVWVTAKEWKRSPT